MGRSTRAWFGVLGAFALAAGASAACVDLFHSTDFATLCDVDADACPADASNADAKPDTKTDGGPLTLCASGPTEAEKRAQTTCAWLGACLGVSAESSYSDCYVRALAAYDCDFNPSLRPRGAYAKLWSCLSTVDGCGAVNSCLFGNAAGLSCNEITTGSFTACAVDAGAVVACGGPATPTGVDSCALRNQVCTKLDPSTARCTGRAADSCDGGTSCDGTYAVRCRSSGGVDADEGLNCGDFGDGRCVAGDAGVACAPTASNDPSAQCTTDGKFTCAGEVAQVCIEGKPIRFTCESLGQSCIPTKGLLLDPMRACSGPHTGGCEPGPDLCNGSKVTSCRDGTTFTLECASVGLGGCKTSANGWATCKVP